MSSALATFLHSLPSYDISVDGRGIHLLLSKKENVVAKNMQEWLILLTIVVLGVLAAGWIGPRLKPAA